MRDVVAHGKRLETATYRGDATRPAIVMLHEGLGSVAMWRDVPQRLAARSGRTVERDVDLTASESSTRVYFTE